MTHAELSAYFTAPRHEPIHAHFIDLHFRTDGSARIKLVGPKKHVREELSASHVAALDEQGLADIVSWLVRDVQR